MPPPLDGLQDEEGGQGHSATHAYPPVKVILGTGTMGSPSDPLVRDFCDVPSIQSCLDLFRIAGFTGIDTARLYPCHAPGTCETLLGATDAKLWASIDTKVYAFPTLHRARILEEIDTSLHLLGVSQVQVYYLHGPDRDTPFEEQCCAVNEAYRAGKFRHFGISNFSPDDVERVVRLCGQNGWIAPTVYQGHYNAISRVAEEALFPMLRRLGIKFYAYSPGAGGMFSGTTTADEASKKQGRRWKQECRIATVFRDWYHTDAVILAAHMLSDGAEKAGLSSHAVSLRWVLHHSALSGEHGDAIIFGASTLEHMRANIDACTAGPLSDELVALVDSVWDVAKVTPPPAWV